MGCVVCGGVNVGRGNWTIEVESDAYAGDFYYFEVCSNECANECGGGN